MSQEGRLLPLAPDGYRLIGSAAGLALILGAGASTANGWSATLLWLVAAVALLLAGFLVNFFRDPERTPPPDARAVVSPADGKVLIAESDVSEPRFLHDRAAKVSIFMSPLDVHVNRAPVSGEVLGVHYNPGKYLAAFSEKASLDNEQNAVVMRADDGRQVVFIQIAGFLARRIVCSLERGDRCQRGQRVGMIKLGSRVDIFIPGHIRLKVKAGDRVTAGETVLGELL